MNEQEAWRKKILITAVCLMIVLLCEYLLYGFSMRRSYTLSLISDCEQTLSRDQHCKIIAIPDREE